MAPMDQNGFGPQSPLARHTARPGVCLIAEEAGVPSPAGAWLTRCGLTVWTPASIEAAGEPSAYERALCLVIDMPGKSGLGTLELFRSYGIWTPALLIADAKDALPAERLARTGVLDVLARPIGPRELLGWIECLCIAQGTVRAAQPLRADVGARKTLSERFARRAQNIPQSPATTLAKAGQGASGKA